MSISKKMIQNVSKSFLAINKLAAKEDDPEIDKGKEDTETGKPPMQAAPRGLNITGRIYFYAAPDGKQINFRNLWGALSGNTESVDKDDKKNIIENLKSGSVDYGGDHFQWTGLMVRAQDSSESKNVVVYTYYLNPWGTYNSGRIDMVTSGNYDFKSPDEFAKEKNLFVLQSEITDMVDLAKGSDTIYSKDTPSKSIAERFLKATPESSVTDKNSDLNHIIPMYRMWVPGIGGTAEGGELRLPEGMISNDDEIGPNKKGQYKGGSQAFQQLMKAAGNPQEKLKKEDTPKEEGAPEESLGKKMEQGKFESVDEQRKTNEDEANSEIMNKSASDYLHNIVERVFQRNKESFIKQVKKDERADYYTGDNSIMMDLARHQAKKMDIRKQAAGSLEMNVPATPEDTDEAGEALKDISNSLKKVQKSTKAIGIKGPMSVMASQIDKVVNGFFDLE